MKQLTGIGWVFGGMVFATIAMADVGPAPVVSAQAPLTIEWNNSHPQQRQALDHFYQSLQTDVSAQPPAPYVIQRQQHIEHIRATRSPSVAPPIPVFQPHSEASRLLQ